MAVAGSKGGIYPGSFDPMGSEVPIVRYWMALGEKALTGEELYSELVARAAPIQLEVGIGNTCGLECRHCFLGYESGPMVSPLVPLERLKEIATECVEQFGTKIYCLTDRDALTPGRSIPFFEHLATLREKYPDLHIGGVTNGLAIDKYVEPLRRIKLDYIDVSVDGLEYEHDAIRGHGTFRRTIENIRLAMQEDLAARVLVAPTLTRFNSMSLVEMVVVLARDVGVRWFDIGPLMAVKMQEFQLRECDVALFISELCERLNSESLPHPITVFMEICAYCAAFIPGLIDAGWLIPDRIQQDYYGHLYQRIALAGDNLIYLRPELIPEYWRYNLRVAADGFVVGGCEPLSQPDYHRLAVGNVTTQSMADLYPKAIAVNSPFYKMMVAYDRSPCRNKACFLHCLGGDSLLSASVYGDFNRKDPNCAWEEYRYVNIDSRKEPLHAAPRAVP